MAKKMGERFILPKRTEIFKGFSTCPERRRGVMVTFVPVENGPHSLNAENMSPTFAEISNTITHFLEDLLK